MEPPGRREIYKDSSGGDVGAVLGGSALLLFLSAFFSVRFVCLRRLGSPWLLVSFALGSMGGVYAWDAVHAAAAGTALPREGAASEYVVLMVSLLFASGFALTEQWFALKERLEGRFRLIAEADRALVGTLDEDKILSAVCRVLAHGRACRLAWVAAAEADGSVRALMSAGEAEGLLSEVSIRWDDSPEGSGPTGTALRTGRSAAARLSSGAGSEPLKEAAVRHGIRAAASIPLDMFSHSIMALTVYSGSASAFDAVEMDALQELVHRIGAALQSARRHSFFVSAKSGYDDLLKTQRDGVILVREDRIVRANPAAVAMLGCSGADDLLGKHPAEVLVEPENLPLLSGLLSPKETGAPQGPLEVPIRMRNGSSFAGELTATWLPRSNSTVGWVPSFRGPLGMIILRDISLRKQVMEDLRREHDFSGKMLDIAGVLVAQLGPEGEIILFNRQCEDVTGYRSREVVGRKIADALVAERAREPYRRAFDEMWKGKAPAEIETPVVTRTGEERTVVWSHAAIRDDDGKTASLIATGTDLTEKRQLEAQLIEMQKMEAVGTLAGGIAHDFNNILTGILGNLDLALSSLPGSSPASLPLNESIKASERAAQLIRQLLEFSRRAPLERRAVDLGWVAHEVVRLFSQTIDKRIEVDISVADGLWLAAADSSQSHQVIMNLCVNARDAVMERLERERDGMRIEGGRIHLRVRNAVIGEEYCRAFSYARPGKFVLLEISDNGIGMDTATQARVFEPFFTTKMLGRGTGLGLSTVYGIIKQHEGWVNLESRFGKGTTFLVYVPVAKGVPSERPAPREAVEPRPGKETVLFVDDEEMIRDLARQVLETHGYTVLTAADGQQALDLFVDRHEKIDLVILDQTMPNLSGIETLERMRAVSGTVRVILSSGYPQGREYFARGATGASAFLQKPYRAGVLARTVREVLDRRPGRDEAGLTS